MPKPIFYFRNFEAWDKLTLTAYIFLSIGIWYLFIETANPETQSDIVFCYAIGTQLFFYFLNYKSLRNLTVYFSWMAIGVLHFYVYYQLQGNTMLQEIQGHPPTGLRNTIILLLLFQILRVISARTQCQELVGPSMYSRTDIWSDRRVTFIDLILFVIYIGTAVILLYCV